jgi:hypothetical protein
VENRGVFFPVFPDNHFKDMGVGHKLCLNEAPGCFARALFTDCAAMDLASISAGMRA